MIWERKYDAATEVYGVCVTAGAALFKVDPTRAAGDFKISKDGGAFVNLATLPAVLPAGGRQIKYALSAAEMQCKTAMIIQVDLSGDQWEDSAIIIETYGHASARHLLDRTVAMRGTDAAGTATDLGTVDTVVDGIQTDLSNVTDGLGALKTLLDAIPTTVMRGTDSAATAANLTTVNAVVDAIKSITDNLPDSGALTAIGIDTARLTEVRAAVLTDWINTGRLDTLLDAIPTTAMRGTDNASTAANLSTLDTKVDDIQGATFSSATDSLEAIRDRGDAEWTTGGGGGGGASTLLHSTTIATLTTQIQFTLTDGSADSGAYEGSMAVITDASTATQKSVSLINQYTGGSKQIILTANPSFTIATGDTVEIFALPYNQILPSTGALNSLAEITRDILLDTAEIGVDGVGLTNLGGMSAGMKTSVEDSVWDATLASHLNAGSTGKELDDLPHTGIFVTGFANAGSGSVSSITYGSPQTEPSNKILTGGESDDNSITITAEIHTLGDIWQPTSVDLYRDDVALTLDIDKENWTQLDDRVFQVVFTVNDASATATYHVQTSDGKVSGDFAYVRGSDAPSVSSAVWGEGSFNAGVYPTAATSPASLSTGIQTAVKSGDTVSIQFTIGEQTANTIKVASSGASSSTQTFDGTFTVGVNTITGVVVGSASGNQVFTVSAKVTGGSYGASDDTAVIAMDQASHSYASFVTSGFSGTNFALKSGDSATGTTAISNWNASDKIVYNFDDGNITADTTYVAGKTYNCTGGTYRDSGTNVQIDSRRKANGKGGTSQKTGLMKVANVAPTLSMSGATSRLRSQASGGDQTYGLTLTGSQELKDTPTCVRDSADDGPALGAWSGSAPDKTWTNTITVQEDDTKNVGAASHTWETILATNGAGTTVAAIGTNPNYTIGGFEERDVALAKFDQFEPIGTMATNKDNPNKLLMEYVGLGAGTYVTNTTDDPGSKKFTIVNSGGTFDADGDHVKCNDSNIYDATAYTMRIEESV